VRTPPVPHVAETKDLFPNISRFPFALVLISFHAYEYVFDVGSEGVRMLDGLRWLGLWGAPFMFFHLLLCSVQSAFAAYSVYCHPSRSCAAP